MASRAQFMFLAIKHARFHLREMRDVIRIKDLWIPCIKMTHQPAPMLPRGMGRGPYTHSNGRFVHKPAKTVYMHIHSSGYGWIAALNDTSEAHGFRHNGDREVHITYKELEDGRYTVLTFLVHMGDGGNIGGPPQRWGDRRRDLQVTFNYGAGGAKTHGN
eukprot:jgi/Tetstr1/429043/TSEL_019008.t1